MGQEGDFNIRDISLEMKLVKEEFMNADIESVSVIERVNNFNSSLVSIEPLMFISGAPMNHRATLIYNNFISKEESRSKYPKIQNGEKVGVYPTAGKNKDDDVFAFPIMSGLPNGSPPINRKAQFEKVILSPINNILKVINTDYKLDFGLNITSANLW